MSYAVTFMVPTNGGLVRTADGVQAPVSSKHLQMMILLAIEMASKAAVFCLWLNELFDKSYRVFGKCSNVDTYT